ncbi:MAG: DEAD/DEAH box helicase family protein, partial [Coriobacteriia bacterium]|nr:DEAD/DEAH box helicase family protein [Coriobacteriia bacterium]
MNDKTAIKPMEEFEREIYGYTLPEVPKHNESVKVGETTGDVETRVRQQTGTAGLNPDILFDRPALHADNKPFTDKKLHSFFKLSGIPKANPNDIADEWFIFGQNLGLAEELTDRFINYDYRDVQVSDEKFEYILRKEQADAVSAAAEYVQKGEPSKQFLWNAKPRFGKTLSTYDLILRLAAKKTLIVTNRPAIANSWYDDFQKFIAWQDDSGKFKFVSSTDALKNKAMTRDEYIDFHLATKNAPGEDRFVAFISLQDLKGAEFAGGRFDKLDWVGGLEWDLLVIDEAHEGVDTLLTDQAFEGITRAFTLHLSGTPFKALADNKFSADQIYNWSYVDEQEARTNWDYAKGENPYENLPELSLFTYQMSKLVEDHIAQGVKIESETNLDYAFDLNEFFKTKDNGKFEHEADVIKFLDKLCTGNLPFSSDQYRSELAHTFWLLPRVASAKALEKLLSDHSYFKDYEVVLAAGDGVARDEAVSDYAKSKRSYDRANKAIKNYDKTITLSVGQLTTGVTIPQWTAIFMLNNIQSPALYFQAAFRVQNPYEYVCDDGTMMRKERAYIFDFAPERTLQLFSDFATGLAGNPDSFPAAEREEQIKNLLNFFPVISEDDKGSMYPLDLSDVLTIPNRIKSAEVISRGFMSNLLFDNIANIFNAPQEVIDLLNQIPPERRGRHQPRKDITRRNPMVDEKGNVAVPGEIVINTTKDLFGAKIYELRSAPDELLNTRSDRLASTIIEELDEGFQKLRPEFSFTVAKITDIKSKAKKNLGYEMAEALDHYQNDLAELKQKEEAALAQASGSEEKSEIRTQVAQEQKALHTTYRADIESRV